MAEQRANEWAGKARGILKLSEVFRWVSGGKCSLEMKICRGSPWRKDPHPYSWRMAVVSITDVHDISKQISEPDKIHNILDLDPVLLKYSFAFFTCSGMKVWKFTDSGRKYSFASGKKQGGFWDEFTVLEYYFCTCYPLERLEQSWTWAVPLFKLNKYKCLNYIIV